MLWTIWVVYSLLALKAYDFGHYVNPNSWIKANLPKVTNPTRASGGIIFKLYYSESLTASSSSLSRHVSTKNKKTFGVGSIDLLMYSIVVFSAKSSKGKVVSVIFSAYC
jgi:hypothetical protein